MYITLHWCNIICIFLLGSFVCLFVCSFTPSFVRSFFRSFVCLFVCFFLSFFLWLVGCLFVLFVWFDEMKNIS